MGMPLYQCFPPTGYSSRGSDWLDPSGHLYRVNFAFDLASSAVAGVAAGTRTLLGATDLSSPAAIAQAVNAELFAGQLSAATLAAASGVDTRSSVNVASRTVGLLLASPEFQVR
jgi:hypothetical protein